MQKNQFFSLLALLPGAFAGYAQQPVDTLPPPLMEELLEAPPVPEAVEKTYEVFDIQKAPFFPGGEAEMLKFLQANLKYPPLARENGIQGTVAVDFVVEKDGSIIDVRILKDIGGGCGKEAARVVRMMPRWTPGEANGKPVRVRFTLPVRFRLEGDEPATVVEYPGGQAALDAFLEKNVKYPKKARRAKVQGVVKVECEVGPDGQLKNPKVVDGLGHGCDEEALRVVKKMPKWVIKRGNPVKVTVEVPFGG